MRKFMAIADHHTKTPNSGSMATLQVMVNKAINMAPWSYYYMG